MRPLGIIIALSLLGVGCSYHARNADSYRNDTRSLLETKSGDIQACFDDVLKKNPKAGGTVVVKFTVMAETGEITQAAVKEKGTTAGSRVGDCVVGAISGLKLKPGDARNGDATFSWEFTAG